MSSEVLAGGRYDVVHLSTVHRSSDNRIYRKECTALHEAGVSVAFVSRGPAPQGDVPWVELPDHGTRLGRMIRGPWNAWRELKRLRPRVLQVHDPELIPLALAWKRRTGGRVVYDAHEDLPKQVAGKPYLPRWSRSVVAWFAGRVERAAEHGTDAIVAATPSIARNFTGASRVALVQNFPWLRDYPDPTSVSHVPPASACYVGGLSPARGSEQMCTAVAQTSTAVHLTFAGAATPQAAAHLVGLGAQITDLGTLPAEEVPLVVAGSALGLVLFLDLPNHVEAQPTKLFEYMAAGRPFVASDFPYWRQLLGGFDCGVFVDPADPRAIAAGLDSLVLDPARLREMGSRGRAALEAHFTFEIESESLVSLTLDLLARER